MSNVINKLVLKLNANWHAFEVVPMHKAITMLCSESNGEKPGYAMDFETRIDENGNSVLVFVNPTPWDQWIKLPVRDCDFAIDTSRGPIRAPLAVICANYNKVPMVSPRLNNAAILKRDGYTCQYTNKKLHPSKVNVDHIIPLDRGGKDAWDNMVACDKEVNFKKGNRLNEEVNLKLIKLPKAPQAVPKIVRPEDLPDETRHLLLPFLH